MPFEHSAAMIGHHGEGHVQYNKLPLEILTIFILHGGERLMESVSLFTFVKESFSHICIFSTCQVGQNSASSQAVPSVPPMMVT